MALLPLVLLPMFAVRDALRTADEAEEHREAAERAAEEARAVAADKARLAETQRELVERLRESDRLKDDLLAAVSHELRTPLAGMSGALATLSAREGQLTDPQRQELVDMADRQGDRLKLQIEQLLLAARLERSGHEPAERPVVDAAALARDAVAAARPPTRRGRWSSRSGRRCPSGRSPRRSSRCWATCSTTRPSTPPTRRRSGWRPARLAPRPWCCPVDTGPGVPPAERERIFERFTQLDSGSHPAGRRGRLRRHRPPAGQRPGRGARLATDPADAGQGAWFELRLLPWRSWPPASRLRISRNSLRDSHGPRAALPYDRFYFPGK